MSLNTSIEKLKSKKKSVESNGANNSGGYKGPFENYYKLYGIRLEKILAKIPYLNGVTERINRTSCKERIRCMLSYMKLPKSFWRKAMRTAIDLINLSPLAVLDGDRVWTGKDISFDHLRVFGCQTLFIFRTMKDLSLMIWQNCAFSWDMDTRSLDIDYEIQ